VLPRKPKNKTKPKNMSREGLPKLATKSETIKENIGKFHTVFQRF
jgi:hypothetical protein